MTRTWVNKSIRVKLQQRTFSTNHIAQERIGLLGRLKKYLRIQCAERPNSIAYFKERLRFKSNLYFYGIYRKKLLSYVSHPVALFYAGV